MNRNQVECIVSEEVCKFIRVYYVYLHNIYIYIYVHMCIYIYTNIYIYILSLLLLGVLSHLPKFLEYLRISLFQ